MPAENLLIFFTTSVLLALTPGPDNIFVLSQSLAFGRRPGLLIVLGLCSGLIIHTALVVFGVAAIITASSRLLFLIKLSGTFYLLYLAWLSWQLRPSSSLSSPSPALSPWQLYRRGFIMNVSNPKVVIFFLAFLPQFVDESYGSISMQLIILGFLFMLATLLIFGGIALLAGRYSQYLNHSESGRMVLNRLVSMVFVMIALNLFFSGVSTA
jgi:threonine/homoserine/homoserine lactone efflux protein